MNALKGKFILLFAKGYSMKNEDNNSINEGISLSYLLVDNLNPVFSSSDEKGIRPAKVSVPLSEGKKIKSVPGLYEGDFAMKAKSDGKVEFKLETLEFLNELKLENVSPTK